MKFDIRILTSSHYWQGANDYSFVRAFRRAECTTLNVSIDDYFPRNWSSLNLKLLRRLTLPMLTKQYNEDLKKAACEFKPDIFFAFKGALIKAETLQFMAERGVTLIQFYPDTGFSDHGPHIGKAISHYDWVFTTKPAGVMDLANNYNQPNASFISHSFDPETHRPYAPSSRDKILYGADVCFVGDSSAKKRISLEHIASHCNKNTLKIWGPITWQRDPSPLITGCYQGRTACDMEYSKAISLSKINLGLLYEGNASAPQSDLITARTFEIPAMGGFLLHERTDKLLEFFSEDKEVACFKGDDELVDKINYYLNNNEQRKKIAQAGHKRATQYNYSVDSRVQLVLDKYYEINS